MIEDILLNIVKLLIDHPPWDVYVMMVIMTMELLMNVRFVNILCPNVIIIFKK